MIYAEDVDYTKVLNAQPGQAPAGYQPQQGFQQQPTQGFNPGQF